MLDPCVRLPRLRERSREHECLSRGSYLRQRANSKSISRDSVRTFKEMKPVAAIDDARHQSWRGCSCPSLRMQLILSTLEPEILKALWLLAPRLLPAHDRAWVAFEIVSQFTHRARRVGHLD